MLNTWQSVKITDPDHPSAGRAGVVIEESGGKVLVQLDAQGTDPSADVLAEVQQLQVL